MPRKTTTKKVKEPAVATETSEVAVESEAKKKFRIFMENYKAQNPNKYAHKEVEFIKKLNSL